MRSLVSYDTLILNGLSNRPLSLATCIALGIPLAIHLHPKEDGDELLFSDKKGHLRVLL